MPKKINLSMPEPRLCPGYKEYSSTKVPWLPGLDGNVEFIPWPEFDDEVKAATSMINLILSKEELEAASNHFRSARDQANPTRLPKDGLDVDARPIFTDCTSVMPIVSSMFSGISEVVQRLLRTRKFTMITKRVRLGKPTELPKDLRVLKKSGGKQGQAAPSKERIPDYTLMKLSTLEDVVGEPICAFELKGPCLDILGTPFRESRGDAYHAETAHAVANAPAQESGTNARVHDNRPVGASRKAVTAEVLCKRFNELLPGDTVRNTKGWRSLDEPSAAARKPLAQALSYALSVTSGCTFLFNYVVGFALKIVKSDDRAATCGSSNGDEKNGESTDNPSEGPSDGKATESSDTGTPNKVFVKVSNPFFLSDDPGPLDAIIASCLHGVTTVDDDSELAEFLESLADYIDAESKRESPGTGSEGERSRGSASKRAVSFNESKDAHASKRPRQESLEKFETHDVREKSASQDVNTVLGSETESPVESERNQNNSTYSYEEARKDFGFHNDGSDRGIEDRKDCKELNGQTSSEGTEEVTFSNCTAAATMDVQEAHVIRRLKLVGQGRSGNISEAAWKGRRVAIKEWNGIEEDGRTDLIHEIEILKSIMERSPSLLGSVIPNVLLAWSPPESSEEDPILVTEYVGQSIRAESDGRFYVGDHWDESSWFEILASERVKIGNEALRALEILHSNGYVHGDVAIRNLRVQVNKGQDCTTCKVWWIDFGHSMEVVPDPKLRSFARERRDCAALFHLSEKDIEIY